MQSDSENSNKGKRVTGMKRKRIADSEGNFEKKLKFERRTCDPSKAVSTTKSNYCNSPIPPLVRPKLKDLESNQDSRSRNNNNNSIRRKIQNSIIMNIIKNGEIKKSQHLSPLTMEIKPFGREDDDLYFEGFPSHLNKSGTYDIRIRRKQQVQQQQQDPFKKMNLVLMEKMVGLRRREVPNGFFFQEEVLVLNDADSKILRIRFEGDNSNINNNKFYQLQVIIRSNDGGEKLMIYEGKWFRFSSNFTQLQDEMRFWNNVKNKNYDRRRTPLNNRTPHSEKSSKKTNKYEKNTLLPRPPRPIPPSPRPPNIGMGRRIRSRGRISSRRRRTGTTRRRRISQHNHQQQIRFNNNNNQRMIIGPNRTTTKIRDNNNNFKQRQHQLKKIPLPPLPPKKIQINRNTPPPPPHYSENFFSSPTTTSKIKRRPKKQKKQQMKKNKSKPKPADAVYVGIVICPLDLLRESGFVLLPVDLIVNNNNNNNNGQLFGEYNNIMVPPPPPPHPPRPPPPPPPHRHPSLSTIKQQQ